MERDASAIVRAGYDTIALRYLEWAREIVDDPRARFAAELESRLPSGSLVVDLGCGAGVPSTKDLARRHSVVGVDIAPEQIRLAEARVPEAEFICMDLLDVSFAQGTRDAVTAFYSLIHVSRDQHDEVFRRVRGWLRPGGLFLMSLSAGGESDGIQDDFLGVSMYFSGFGPDTNRRLLREAGFELLVDEVVTMHEPEGDASFHWLLGQAAESA